MIDAMINLEMNVKLTLDPNGSSTQDLIACCHQAMRDALNRGTFTEGLPATVETYSYSVKEVKD